MCNKEHFWRTLAQELGHPEWLADARFGDYAARLAHRAELERLLDEALQAQPSAHWLERFAGRIPAAPVHDIAQALGAELVRARGNVRTYRYDDGRGARMVASPVRLGAEALPERAAPALGAHTDEVLGALGYAPERIAELRRRGVV